MRAVRDALFILLWAIAFGAIYKLLWYGVVGQIFEAKWRSATVSEHVFVIDISIIKKRNDVLSGPDYQRDYRSIYCGIFRCSFSWIQSSSAVRWKRKWEGSTINGKSEICGESLTKSTRPIAVFDEDIIGWRSPAVFNNSSNNVIGHVLAANFNGLVAVGGIAQGTLQDHVSDYANIGAQLSLGCFYCIVSGPFCLIGEPARFGNGSIGFAERGESVLMLLFSASAHFPSLPASETCDDEGRRGERSGSIGKIPRPLNKFALMGGIVIIFVGFPLLGKAFETLFFLDDRRHGLTVIIFCVLCSLACIAAGTFLIVEMT